MLVASYSIIHWLDLVDEVFILQGTNWSLSIMSRSSQLHQRLWKPVYQQHTIPCSPLHVDDQVPHSRQQVNMTISFCICLINNNNLWQKGRHCEIQDDGLHMYNFRWPNIWKWSLYISLHICQVSWFNHIFHNCYVILNYAAPLFLLRGRCYPWEINVTKFVY